MNKNSHYTLESAWEEISKVKSKYNQQKLIELYQMSEPFIRKYQDVDVSVLSTPEFAVDYLPILKLILKQSAGKKFMLNFCSNPWVGITKSLCWYIWMPTKVGSQAAMTVLRSYVDELELQARGQIQADKQTQTDDDFVLVNDHSSKLLVQNECEIDQASESKKLLVPIISSPPENGQNETSNDTAMTSGVGCNTTNDGFSDSDGSTDEIMAEFLEKSRIQNDTPSQPMLNSTFPTKTPISNRQKRMSGPRKLTKGSRRHSLKDSGVNLTSTGAWEDSRKTQVQETPEDILVLHDEIEEIELTELEISNFENGEDDVFNDSGESFVEIPELE